MSSHKEMERFKCDECDKDFSVEWRMRKHNKAHAESTKYCHYYNNAKDCPYYDIGCKFRHKESEQCKFKENCRFKLCQFRHDQTQNMLKRRILCVTCVTINQVIKKI